MRPLSETGGGVPIPEIIAHRGYSAAFPENTIPALEGALDAGATSLEWDLRVTADGIPVVFHDEFLERTTNGVGPMGSLTADQVGRLDAGSWFSPRFAGVRVPTLKDALLRIRSRATRIYPEIKAVRGMDDLGHILSLVTALKGRPQSVLISLRHDLLEEIRRRDRRVALGWVVEREEDLDRCARRVEEDPNAILDPDARLLLADPERTRYLVARGIPMATWTVNDPADAAKLFSMGVSRITTNRVSLLLDWARTLGPPPTATR